MWRAATLLCVACCSQAFLDLDVDDSFSASKHHQGAQIAEWLSNADLVSLQYQGAAPALQGKS